jgi:hypothetical protein
MDPGLSTDSRDMPPGQLVHPCSPCPDAEVYSGHLTRDHGGSVGHGLLEGGHLRRQSHTGQVPEPYRGGDGSEGVRELVVGHAHRPWVTASEGRCRRGLVSISSWVLSPRSTGEAEPCETGTGSCPQTADHVLDGAHWSAVTACNVLHP